MNLIGLQIMMGSLNEAARGLNEPRPFSDSARLVCEAHARLLRAPRTGALSENRQSEIRI